MPFVLLARARQICCVKSLILRLRHDTVLSRESRLFIGCTGDPAALERSQA